MKKLKSNAGFTMILFLALLLMLTLAGINAVMTSTTDVNIAGNEMNQNNALYAAEAGLERATAKVEYAYRTNGSPPDPLPAGQFTLSGGGEAPMTINYSVQQISNSELKTLHNGAYEGLYAYATEFEVSSEAGTSNNHIKSDLRMLIESDLIPLYQFAVFYESVLEMSPGPQMALGGRVHSNSDIYIQSGNSLQLNSHLTAAGNIFHGPFPDAGQTTNNGDVLIMDRDGNLVSMYQSGDWVDANSATWVDNSLNLWGGRVEDGSHGITELNLPVVRSGDPIDMIKNASESPDSYENKASLRLVDGKAYKLEADGSLTNITVDLAALGVVSSSTFYDARENKTIKCTDIDIGALNASGYWPSNGIIYTTDKQNPSGNNATRLVNGNTLSSGLTICSRDPVYVHGDFNTVSKKPAAIMSDALTILSNGWVDGDGTLSITDPNRKAAPTTVNVSYMTGNVPSATGQYSGGFDNLPRFLEDWEGINFTWTGSAIDLWESEIAIGQYSYGIYYKAPNRNWAFDTDLLDPANLPPGTPLISVVQRTGWREAVAFRKYTSE
ncbi:MAG TPA: hypothetical protein ENO22_10510 [candidate division Zixibacteria bacterium]|nr:hypothetical protein [candidate division Zixibacteria bacterium]